VIATMMVMETNGGCGSSSEGDTGSGGGQQCNGDVMVMVVLGWGKELWW